MNTSFETSGRNDEWLTPPQIIKDLGHFDLDPCAPINRLWNTAAKHYTIKDDGLKQEWKGRVWCNPPYGNETKKWLKKCKEYGNAIVLIFARTETKMFFEHIWNDADAMFFFKGRLKFHYVSGEQGQSAGAPSVLVAYGENNVKSLEEFSKNWEGKFVRLKQ